MDYSFALKRAIDMAFKYPSLWVFGLFTSLGSGNLNFDIPERFLPTSGRLNRSQLDLAWVESFIENNLAELAVGLILIILLAITVALLLQSFATPALIDSVNKLNRGGTYSFTTAVSRGFHYLPRFLGLTLIEIALVVIGVAMIIPIAVLVPLLLILVIPVLVVVAIALSHIFQLAKVSLVARDSTISSALDEGWNLFKNNLGPCAVLTALFIAIIIALVIAFMIIAMFTFLPLNALIGGVTENLLIYLILAIFIGLPVSVVLGGISGVFFESWYTVFYFELTDPQSLRPTAPGPQPISPTPM